MATSAPASSIQQATTFARRGKKNCAQLGTISPVFKPRFEVPYWPGEISYSPFPTSGLGLALRERIALPRKNRSPSRFYFVPFDIPLEQLCSRIISVRLREFLNLK